MTPLILLGAVVAGWLVQSYLTIKQSTAFNRAVAGLRSQGTVCVGVGGRRYRGGRAFVALAVDDHATVHDALVLSGWTTFSRAKPLPAVRDVSVRRLRGDEPLAGLTKPQREAARQAAGFYKSRVRT